METTIQAKKTRTILGDDIDWIDHLGCPVETAPDDSFFSFSTWKSGDDQLHRCRKQKEFEARLLMTLPHGASYLDVGAHFGDSVIVMAAYARSHGRGDLMFFAFEPSHIKCEWLRRVVDANELNNTVKVIQIAIGDAPDQWVAPQVMRNPKVKARCLLNGSLGYDLVSKNGNMSRSDSDDDSPLSTSVRMTTLDSFSSLVSPMGILHLDVEGWEPQSLHGAKHVLAESATPSYVIVEAWNDKQCYQRGAQPDATGRVEQVMEDFNRSNPKGKFHRGQDLVDCGDRNLFYYKAKGDEAYS